MWLVPLLVLAWITKINSNKWQMGPCSLQDHVKDDGEELHYNHAHTAVVMTFESKGCVTWCPKSLQDKDHTYIFESMNKRIMMSSRCLAQPKKKTIGYTLSRLASGQVSRRSQGTLLPSSGEPKVSNLWNIVWHKSWSNKAENLWSSRSESYASNLNEHHKNESNLWKTGCRKRWRGIYKPL
jgi:hypothetical protein